MKDGGAGQRKRKQEDCWKQPSDQKSTKSRRTLVEETNCYEMINSRTLRPATLGAKSGLGREPDDRRQLGAGIKEKDGGNSHGTFGKTKTRTHK